jgi:hypothetical protein
MSTSHHQHELPDIAMAQPEQMKRVVAFIDRFTARIVEKLQALEQNHGIAASKALTR